MYRDHGVHSPDEVAVCNLASIALPMFVKDGAFDHDELYRVTKQVTKNLNRVIDRNYYPVQEAENSNMRHRPVGLRSTRISRCLYTTAPTIYFARSKRLKPRHFRNPLFCCSNCLYGRSRKRWTLLYI